MRRLRCCCCCGRRRSLSGRRVISRARHFSSTTRNCLGGCALPARTFCNTLTRYLQNMFNWLDLGSIAAVYFGACLYARPMPNYTTDFSYIFTSPRVAMLVLSAPRPSSSTRNRSSTSLVSATQGVHSHNITTDSALLSPAVSSRSSTTSSLQSKPCATPTSSSLLSTSSSDPPPYAYN